MQKNSFIKFSIYSGFKHTHTHFLANRNSLIPVLGRVLSKVEDLQDKSRFSRDLLGIILMRKKNEEKTWAGENKFPGGTGLTPGEADVKASEMPA